MTCPVSIPAPAASDLARPVVSIITATFNAAPALRATIQSVAAENTGTLEHIVIDGGSDDGTRELLKTAPDHVRWISEPDGGIADAMNKAVALSRGTWILCLHAGDTLAGEGALSSAIARCTGDVDVLACAITFGKDGQGRRLFVSNPETRLRFKTILHQGALCRRDLFERIGGFDTSFAIAMDYEFFLRALAAGARIVPCEVTLSCMDDEGVGSWRDFASRQQRFSEERRAQRMHATRSADRLIYALYWPLYLLYHRARRLIRGGEG